jgi:hypothetical protein
MRDHTFCVDCGGINGQHKRSCGVPETIGYDMALYAWARQVSLIGYELYEPDGGPLLRHSAMMTFRACSYLPPHRNFYILNPFEEQLL